MPVHGKDSGIHKNENEISTVKEIKTAPHTERDHANVIKICIYI